MSVSTTHTHIRMHHVDGIHACSMLASNTHASHQQPSLLLICFCYQQLQTNPPSTSPSFCPLILTQPPTSFTGCCWLLFPWLCILFLWRSLEKQNNRAQGCMAFQAWKGAEALSSCLSNKHKKRAQLGTASQQMAFPGRELASVPGRDWQTCPGRALANVPRQGTGKASQAGTAKCAKAGHWQTFPGRELASVPGRDCKHAQAGHAHWQAFQGRKLASVPGRDCKRAQAGHWQMWNCRRPQAGDSGCFQAGNCRHCKS